MAKRFLKVASGLDLFHVLIISILAFSSGCVPTVPAPVTLVDNPQHSYNNGLKFLEKGEYEWALAEFERALVLDPKFSPAYVGIGLVKGAKGNFAAAFEAMAKAKELDGGLASAAMIRLYTMQKAEGWLGRAEAEFETGRQKQPQDPALYFFMGKAYKETLELGKALSMFQKVRELKGAYQREAELEASIVDKIQRARPSSEIGRQIALKEKLTRLEVALLLLDEGGVDKLLRERPLRPLDSPGRLTSSSQEKVPLAVDILDHPYRDRIEAILSLRIRGLEAFPDRTFSPASPLSRADYAVILEDILIKVTNEKGLATRYLGQSSPLDDVESSNYAYNAIMLLFARNILELKSPRLFSPEEPMTGSDALLALRRLRDELRLH
ncbi:MAG: S-layer homology domain-containing protein [candidate division NC10 bacterium]|nr:S-layer homology domain-containing protein [candidate division NC10 bacterium]